MRWKKILTILNSANYLSNNFTCVELHIKNILKIEGREEGETVEGEQARAETLSLLLDPSRTCSYLYHLQSLLHTWPGLPFSCLLDTTQHAYLCVLDRESGRSSSIMC